ncbi:MAG TPA: transglycosylase SLT domain-containing protein [Rhodocyclaceae bacterium]|nr:transglycosylase SLT domain-containing protein [Rhodocyclaceae bacterium]
MSNVGEVEFVKECYVMGLRLCAVLMAVLCLTGQVARADAGDDRILATRDAAARGDTARLAGMAATPSNHVLEPYVSYWLLSARITRLTESLPTQDIRDFLHQNEGSLLAEQLRSEWLKRIGHEEQWSVFNDEYAKLIQPDQELQCYAILGHSAAASAASLALESQWTNLVDLPDACQGPMQDLIASGRIKTDDIWMRFRRQIEAARLSGARVTASWLDKDKAPSSTLLNRAYGDPAHFLLSTAARNTSSRTAREITLAALTRLARSDPQAAYDRWRVIDSAAYSEDERAYIMGQFAWMAALEHQPEARTWYAAAQGVPMSDDQYAWYARAALRAGDWTAVRTAVEIMPTALSTQPVWTYWLGRAQAAQGQSQEAQAQYQRCAGDASFYGILCSEALGNNFVWPQAALPATMQELAQVQAVPEFQRVLALVRLNMRTEAVREWSWGLRGMDDRMLLAAAEFARRQGLYDRAISAADRTKQQHDYGLRYLAPYFETFAPNARANSLDLPWVYGLVRQESRFLTIAHSGAGAQGLMQVMPATGKWVASKIGLHDYHVGQLAQVDTNVQLGTAYLRTMLEGLSNSPVLASAAYNAGPNRARRWRGERPMEGAIYAETIPVNETRDYVKKVMANAVIYASLFDSRPASLTSRLGIIAPAGANDTLAADIP